MKFGGGIDDFGQFLPALIALQLENVQINADQLGIVLFEERGDGRFQLFGVEVIRNVISSAFAVVFDAKSIEEFGEQCGVGFEKPELENLLLAVQDGCSPDSEDSHPKNISPVNRLIIFLITYFIMVSEKRKHCLDILNYS